MTTKTLRPVFSLPSAGDIIPIVVGGMISGVFLVVVAVSFATLIYADAPPHAIGQAVSLVLVGAAVTTFVTSLFSSYPGTIALPQDSPAAILALTTAAMAGPMAGQGAEARFYTVVAAVLISTVTVGAAMFILGHFRLGRLIRFIPYSVVGGFLAATGWLLLKGGLAIMAELPGSLEALNAVFDAPMLIRWLPGVALALVLFVLMRRFRHPLLVPLMLIAGLVAFFITLFLTQTSLERAADLQLLIGPFPEGNTWQLPVSARLLAADTTALTALLPNLATLMLVSVISLLLNCSGIELAVSQDIDLNRELKVSGMTNVLTGLAGGIPGYPALSVTLIARMIGSNSRLLGVVAALVGLAAAVAGSQLLSLFPRAVLGGLVMFLGLHLLVEWVYDARRQMPHADYAVVLLILLVVMLGGYLEGIAIGLLAAVALFLVDYSRHSVVKQVFTGDAYRSSVIRSQEEQRYLCEQGQALLILRLNGYIFFGTANSLLELIRQRLAEEHLPALQYVVLDFRLVTNFDTSAVMSFARMKQLAESRGFTLALANLRPEVAARFRSAGDLLEAGPVRQFADLDHAVEWVENRMLSGGSVQIQQPGGSLQAHLEHAMPAPMAAAIVGHLQRISLSAGRHLVHQGELAQELFFIESGMLGVHVRLENGATVRVRTATSGSVLGEIGFYLQSARTASLVAEEDSVVYTLTPAALQQMEQEDPQAAAALHRYLAEMLAQGLADNAASLRAALA